MTGADPAMLLDDGLLYAAFQEQAEAARWTDLHELLALNVEFTHAVFGQLVANAGGKPPQPLKIPRPSDGGKESAVPRVSPSQLAAMLGGRG